MYGEYKKETFTKVDKDGGVYTKVRITSDQCVYECENYTPKDYVYDTFNKYNDGICQSSFKRMREAYADYCESRQWD